MFNEQCPSPALRLFWSATMQHATRAGRSPAERTGVAHAAGQRCAALQVVEEAGGEAAAPPPPAQARAERAEVRAR